MGTDPLHPNRYHRYALPEAAYLADAEEARYVLIAPAAAGCRVEHGMLCPVATGPPEREPIAPAEGFAADDLGLAVQRVCALAAEWLGFDAWEVEQTRRLFLAGS